jgi:hypothetical protein
MKKRPRQALKISGKKAKIGGYIDNSVLVINDITKTTM